VPFLFLQTAADRKMRPDIYEFKLIKKKRIGKKKRPPKGSLFEKHIQVKLESLSDSLLLDFDYRDYGTDESCNPADCDDESSDADAVLRAFEVAWDCHEGGDSESGTDKPNEDVEYDTV